MLVRVLEPEVMDSAAEARDYDSMDHSAVNEHFAADFLRVWDTEVPILDLGTGTAQIPIEIYRQCPRMESALRDSLDIVAVDLAEHMLALARRNVERAGLAERLRVEKADAKHLQYPNGHFGAVISNSIIHHIADPSLCFAEMHRVCSLGGFLFIRDLLRPFGEIDLARIVDVYAAGANDHQRRMFADSLRAALTLDEVRGHVARLGYAAQTVQQTSDRHWTFHSGRA